MLCFDGLLEEPWEQGHRAVKVLYHLEDDTVQVREAFASPSHIPQGRHSQALVGTSNKYELK